MTPQECLRINCIAVINKRSGRVRDRGYCSVVWYFRFRTSCSSRVKNHIGRMLNTCQKQTDMLETPAGRSEDHEISTTDHQEMLERVNQHEKVTPPSARDSGTYDVARKHSARVKRLKFLLPLAALVVSLAFIGVSVVRTWMPEEVSIESARIESGKIVMEKPAISGRNEQGIDYSMTATRALQDIANPNIMSLENILAAVPMNDIVAQVKAAAGIFDRALKQMKMTEPFTINLSNGIAASFESADIDIAAGTLLSDAPVNITTKDGSIVAQSLRMTDKGRNITFVGQVRVKAAPTTIRKATN